MTDVDIALERALEGLFRLGANRRFESRQTAAVGAVVTRAGYAALRALADHGTLNVRQLAAACAMDAAAASRQVVALVDEGLVTRSATDGDGRSVDLTLTAHGREVYDRIARYRLVHLTGVLQDWSAADKAQLADLVDRLSEALAEQPFPR